MYVIIIETSKSGEINVQVVNQVHPFSEQEQAFFGGTEDGPSVMVNLLKFREKAVYPDTSDAVLSCMATYCATA